MKYDFKRNPSHLAFWFSKTFKLFGIGFSML
jgi:hypothetical protein